MSNNIKFRGGLRTLIVGTSGSGKTLFIKKMLKEAKGIPVILIDVKNDINSPNFQNIDESYFVNPTTRNSIIEQLFSVKSKICIKGNVLRSIKKSQLILKDVIITVLTYLDFYKRSDVPQKIIFVVDEADLFHPKSKKSECSEEMMLLMSKARSVGGIGYVITQRPQMLHNDSISNVEQIVLFYANLNDKKVLEKYFEGTLDMNFEFDNMSETEEIPHNFYIKKLGSGWSNSYTLRLSDLQY